MSTSSYCAWLLSVILLWNPCGTLGFLIGRRCGGVDEKTVVGAPTGMPWSPFQLKATKTLGDDDDNFLMDAYRDPLGEIVNPYNVLKVHRRATRQEVKQAYRSLSRRYHPDARRNKNDNGILPGSCNNLDDVRNEWERVKLSYEILSDPISRKRYDRAEAWSDPGQAMQRAAAQAAMDAVASVGKGFWDLGSSMVKEAIGKIQSDSLERQQKNGPVMPQELDGFGSGAGNSTDVASSMTKMALDDDQIQQHLEVAFRARIDHTLEVSRAATGSALFRDRENKPNRGLRSLYAIGMVPRET